MKKQKNHIAKKQNNNQPKFPQSHKPHSIHQKIQNNIKQYLQKQDYSSTLKNFIQQIEKKKTPKQNNIASIIQNFENGQRITFFNSFNRHVPKNLINSDQATMKLEFYLRIYFLIYSIHPLCKRSNIIDPIQMSSFKEFLESRGSELAKTNQFLPFYALPFIQKPQQHPAIKKVFTRQWIKQLEVRLKNYLKQIKLFQDPPQIVEIYENYIFKNQKNNVQIEYVHELQQKNQQLVRILQEYNQKYVKMKQFAESTGQNLIDSQNKWFQLTKELIQSATKIIQILEQYVPSQKQKQVQNAKRKIMKYQKMMNKTLEQLINQDLSVFDKPSVSGIELSLNPQLKQKLIRPLDFKKIKQIFLSDDTQTKNQILLNLRSNIIKQNNPFNQRKIIIHYVHNDLLGIMNENKKIQNQMFYQADQNTKWFFYLIRNYLKLIQAFTNDFYGTSYIIQSQYFMKNIISLLKHSKIDSLICQIITCILQKLSLRQHALKIMLQNNILNIIFDILQQSSQISQYTLQYASALLTNLSMSNLGKDMFEKEIRRLFYILEELLDSQYPLVRILINGTFYSILARNSIREKAIQYGMVKIMEDQIEISQQRYIKQLNYVYERLKGQSPQAQSDNLQDISQHDDIQENMCQNYDDSLIEEKINILEKFITNDHEQEQIVQKIFQQQMLLINNYYRKNQTSSHQKSREEEMIQIVNLQKKKCKMHQLMINTPYQESRQDENNHQLDNRKIYMTPAPSEYDAQKFVKKYSSNKYVDNNNQNSNKRNRLKEINQKIKQRNKLQKKKEDQIFSRKPLLNRTPPKD